MQIKHPSKWTKDEVADWFNAACNGVFQRKGLWCKAIVHGLSTCGNQHLWALICR